MLLVLPTVKPSSGNIRLDLHIHIVQFVHRLSALSFSAGQQFQWSGRKLFGQAASSVYSGITACCTATFTWTKTSSWSEDIPHGKHGAIVLGDVGGDADQKVVLQGEASHRRSSKKLRYPPPLAPPAPAFCVTPLLFSVLFFLRLESDRMPGPRSRGQFGSSIGNVPTIGFRMFPPYRLSTSAAFNMCTLPACEAPLGQRRPPAEAFRVALKQLMVTDGPWSLWIPSRSAAQFWP